jgi:hypothetical protein
VQGSGRGAGILRFFMVAAVWEFKAEQDIVLIAAEIRVTGEMPRDSDQ